MPHYGLNPWQQENRTLQADLFPPKPREEKGEKPGTYLTELREKTIQTPLQKAMSFAKGCVCFLPWLILGAGARQQTHSSGLGRGENTGDAAQVGTIAAATGSFPVPDLPRTTAQRRPPPPRPQPRAAAPPRRHRPPGAPLGSDPRRPRTAPRAQAMRWPRTPGSGPALRRPCPAPLPLTPGEAAEEPGRRRPPRRVLQRRRSTPLVSPGPPAPPRPLAAR